jgi:DNA-binding transcriptional LysR family regulator
MTEAGSAIYERAIQSLSMLEEARNHASNLTETPQGLIKVTTSVAFGKLCVAPVLPEFFRLYPEIKIQLVLLDRTVDLVEEGFDLAIRLTRSPPELLVAKPLMPIEYILCASPRYIKGKRIKTPSDLANLNCLSYGHQELTQEWSFQNGAKRETVKVSGNIAVNSSEVVRDLMLNDIGVGLVASYAVADELSTGKLLKLLPSWKPTGGFAQTAFAVWKPQIHLPQKIRVFVDFLQARLAQ